MVLRAASALQQQAAPLLAEPVAFVDDDAGRRAAAVHIAGRNHARIFLAPLGGGDGLAGTTVGVPVAFAIAREEPEVAVLHQVGRAAGRRVVVVVVEDVAEAGDGLLVAVAEIEPEDFHARATRLHAGREAADVDVAVVALGAGVAGRCRAEHRHARRHPAPGCRRCRCGRSCRRDR